MTIKTAMTTLWGKLTSPRAAGTDEARREYMTRVVMLVVGSVAAPFTLIVAAGHMLGMIPLDTVIILAALSILFMGGWLLTHFGHWKLAGFIPSSILLCTAIYGNYIGGIDAPAMMLYALAVVVAGVLQSTRVQLIFLILSLSGYLGMGYAHFTGALLTTRSGSSMFFNRVTIVVATMLTITLVVWFLREQYRQALAQARDQAENLRAVFESVTDGLVFTNLQGTIQDGNEALVRLFSAGSRVEIIGLNILDLISEIDRPCMAKNMERGKAGTENRVCECRCVTLTSREFHAEINMALVHDASGQPAGFTGILRDVTERYLAQQQLKESEEKFRTTLSAMVDLVFVLDEEGRFVFHHSPSENKLFLPPEHFIGKSVGDILPENIARQFEKAIEKNRQGQSAEFDYSLPAGDEEGWYSLKLSPRILDGRFSGSIAVIRDVTERRQVEQEVRRLNAELDRRVQERTRQLEAANQELDAFSYSVSHDLRAPLRHISGYASILLEDYAPGLDGKVKDLLERIVSSVRRMGELVDGLLELSRLSQVNLKIQPVDLSMTARTILEDLAQAEPQRRVTCQVADGLTAWGDPNLLRVALENLLGNAWKFTAHIEQASVTFGASVVSGETVFYVRDNGAGFDPQYADKMFDPFQRLHPASEFPGSGVGLATVQRIIRRHNGRLWAEGRVGQGAVFFFTLPGQKNIPV